MTIKPNKTILYKPASLKYISITHLQKEIQDYVHIAEIPLISS